MFPPNNRYLAVFLTTSSLLLLAGVGQAVDYPVPDAKTQAMFEPKPTTSPSPSSLSSSSSSSTTTSTPPPPPAVPSNSTATGASPLGQIITNETAVKPWFSRGAIIEGLKTIVDLSHNLTNSTTHWPTLPGFNHTIIADLTRNMSAQGALNETYGYLADSFAMGVHSGTHLDAPRHFSEKGWTVDQIPLDRLIDVPVHLIDLSDKVNALRNYCFQVKDFLDPASNKSLVGPNTVVLVYTGISQSYGQGNKAYYGMTGDVKTNITDMKIPGFSREAAKILADAGVYGVGLDAPSADCSDRHNETSGSVDAVAHVVFSSANIYIIENINSNLAQLLKKDASMRLTIAPLSIVGGSGSPIRLVAVSAHDDCPQFNARNSASNLVPSHRQNLAILVISLSAFAAMFVFTRRPM